MSKKFCIECSDEILFREHATAWHWATRRYCGVVCRNKARQDRERAKYDRIKREYRERQRALEICKRGMK